MIGRWLSFYGLLFLTALILLSVNYFVLQAFFTETFSLAYYVMHAYYMILVVVAQVILAGALRERPQRFVVAFMAVMASKMFLSLGVLVIIVYTGLITSKFFIVNYLLLYLAYSIFSVGQTLKFQKNLAGDGNTGKP